MYKKIILLCLCISLSQAITYDMPSNEERHAQLNIDEYGWMVENKNYSIEVLLSEDVENFISEEEVIRYFKLKLRNFIKDIKIQETIDYLTTNGIVIAIELYKYNKSTPIYTGLQEIKIYNFLQTNSRVPKFFRITSGQAGSDKEIKELIKRDLGKMVEIFAEKYYIVEDNLK